MNRDEWLAERRKHIGSSDAAAILGASPWASALSVWADKMGIGGDEESERLIWGTLLEPVILEEYGRRRSVRVRHSDKQITEHPDKSTHMACTPDGYELDDEGNVEALVEVKTTSAWLRDEWDGDVPLHYQIQVQHQMACTGIKTARIVVLIGGQEMRWFDVERNERFITTLENACRSFWRYVEDGTPPPADGSQASARALERIHPDDSGESVTLPESAIHWDERLAEIKAQKKALENEKRELEARIKSAIGDASYGELPDGRGRFAWKTQERKEFTAAASKSRVLRRGR